MVQRNTIQRGLVLDAAQALLGQHPTADDVYALVHQTHPTVSKATVYRNLHGLAQEGVLLRLKMPAGADRFDCPTKPHCHLCCTRCGRVEDIQLPQADALAQAVARHSGYKVDPDGFVLEGLCPACAARPLQG